MSIASSANTESETGRERGQKQVGLTLLCSAVLVVIGAGCAAAALGQATPELLPGPGNNSLELVQGAGTALCDAYAAFLARGSTNETPREFREPDFGMLHRNYEQDERRLGTKVRDFIWMRDANHAAYVVTDDRTPWRGTPEQLAEGEDDFGQRFWTRLAAFGYRVFSIDIDNDGKLDNVFFMPDDGGFPLLVLNRDSTDVDSIKTERILMHPSRQQAGWPDMRPAWPDELRTFGQASMPGTDAYRGAHYSVALFGGKVYIGFVWDVHPEYSIPDWGMRRTQHLYEVESGNRIERCEIRWH